MEWTGEEIQQIVNEHALVLFMKGTPSNAQCGFSNRAAQVLEAFANGLISQQCRKYMFTANLLAVQISSWICIKIVV